MPAIRAGHLRVACLAAVLGLAGAVWPAAPGGAALRLPMVQTDVERGRDLYLTGCSTCHGVDGRGTRFAQPLIGSGAAAADFMLSTGRMPLDDPAGQLRRKPPAYTPEQIRLLTAYVASLGPGPEIPNVNPEAGDLVRGRDLYSTNCAACHSSAGAGGAVGRGLEAPPLHDATAAQIAEAIRIGPGTMPVFGPDTLTDDDVSSIVRYLVYLRELEDPGGWGLGRVGPIPEGFVAWIIGMGALLLAARWIGERA